jgi:LysM repeat protein
MKARSSARILAPLALIAAVLALVLVFQGSSSDDPASQATTTTTKKPASQAKTTAKTKPAKPKTTKVKSGDTLGAISQRTGVPIAQIEELNPNLDPTALTVGETVKLQP